MKTQKNQLLENFSRRFREINEYMVSHPFDEAGQGGPATEKDTDDGGAPMGPDGGGMPQGPDGGDAPMGPDGGGMSQGPEGFNPQMGGDPNMGGDPSIGGDPNMGADDTNMMQPDDEVIDVSELTDTQKDTEEEVKKLGGQFSKLMNAIKSFEDAVWGNE